ncbi:DUF982 domain-containing protein [Mesorhizobium sp. M7A.F.Ca.CA.001.09.1.1]|uniref:DUF982 domain-containing protein n=1 Tax=Mesorhizobium sp. M7A.F.Ca.CA.001.09.1.1 TaxID=2496718 RepID=UPI000FCCC88A|nr:DUF982 domain-containing protein [Mesorhizobium sp. M7A.F.Ca.CA.001.09.1.1]RUZ17846.1 DUF982 domain-containing protein [Mesorhizobium sp. M7A.F.Ca.CA.001.09.1.1]
MSELILPTPMRIKPHGSDTIRDVTTLRDASEILIDWPQAKRGPFYQAAPVWVSNAASTFSRAAEAQEAFAALCSHAGVLVR